MNANRTWGLRAGWVALVVGLLAPAFAPALVHAAGGFASDVDSACPCAVFTVDGSTEDPTPIGGGFRKIGPMISPNPWWSITPVLSSSVRTTSPTGSTTSVTAPRLTKSCSCSLKSEQPYSRPSR